MKNNYTTIKVLHVCKFESKMASRILMQINWNDNNTIISKNSDKYYNGTNYKKNEKYLKYSYFNTIRESFKKYNCIIFHEQSTLIIMLIIYILKYITNQKYTIIYDMHDFNESISRISYSKLRYLICYGLEYIISKINIKIITVSEGLKNEYIKRYSYRKSITVIYNISNNIYNNYNYMNKNNKILYFGQINSTRLTKETLEEFKKNKKILYIYGKYGNDRKLMNKLFNVYKNNIKYIGEYSANDLNFLKEYRYTLIDYSMESTINIKYCLPNKLFQSLKYGITCIVSDNLVEIKKLFGNFNQNIILFHKSSDIFKLLCNKKYKNDMTVRLNYYLEFLGNISKIRYIKTINGK